MKPQPSSRAYIKRPWRLPKDRGPLEFFTAKVVKTLVKHGWPAVYTCTPIQGAVITHKLLGSQAGVDFGNAVRAAVCVTARDFNIHAEVYEFHGDFTIIFGAVYTLTPSAKFREVKDSDLSGLR